MICDSSDPLVVGQEDEEKASLRCTQVMDSLYGCLIVVRECDRQCDKVEAHQYESATESNQEAAGLTMMDSLVNNLRLNGITIVVELQTFVCVAINLLLIAMACC